MFFGWLFWSEDVVFFNGDDFIVSIGCNIVYNFFSVLVYGILCSLITLPKFFFTGVATLTSSVFFGTLKESPVSILLFLFSSAFF